MALGAVAVLSACGFAASPTGDAVTATATAVAPSDATSVPPATATPAATVAPRATLPPPATATPAATTARTMGAERAFTAPVLFNAHRTKYMNRFGLAPKDVPDAHVARIRIAAADVNTPVVAGWVNTDRNVMLAPRSPWTIAWYDFSALPGRGGNSVFAGHLTYAGIGPAEFWNLRKVRPGDLIHITLTDGTVLTYRAQFNETFSRDTGPWTRLFDPHIGGDVITVYTCDGTFSNGDYLSRRVVRATRVS